MVLLHGVLVAFLHEVTHLHGALVHEAPTTFLHRALVALLHEAPITLLHWALGALLHEAPTTLLNEVEGAF